MIRYATLRRGGARRPARADRGADRRSATSATGRSTPRPSGARFTQLVVPTQAAAQAIVAEVRGGKALDAAAREKGLATAHDRPGRPQAELADQRLGRGGAGRLRRRSRARSPRRRAAALGWYVLRVDAIDRQPGAHARPGARRDRRRARRRAAPRRARRPDRATSRSEFDEGGSLADVAARAQARARQHRAGHRRRPDLRQRRARPCRRCSARVLEVAFEMEEERAAARRGRAGQDLRDLRRRRHHPLGDRAAGRDPRRRDRRCGAATRAPRPPRPPPTGSLARVAQGTPLAAAVAAETRPLPAPQTVDLTREQLARAGPGAAAAGAVLQHGRRHGQEARGAGRRRLVRRPARRDRGRRRSPRTTRSCSRTLQQLGQRVGRRICRAVRQRDAQPKSASSATRRRSRRCAAQLTGQPGRVRRRPCPARCPRTPSEARARLAAGEPALVWRKLVADTETPVGAALKLIEPGRGDFLLESVEGGEVRGRYSLLGLDPDLVFRATGARLRGQPRTGGTTARRSSRCPATASPSCARWSPSCRIDVPEGAAAGARLPGRLFRLRDDRPGREAAARAAERARRCPTCCSCARR